MQKNDNTTGESLEQMQPDGAAQLQENTPSRMLSTLQQALLDFEQKNKELAADSAVLREQLACKVLSWKEENKKMLDEKNSLVSAPFRAKLNLIRTNSCSSVSQKQSDIMHQGGESELKEKEEDVHSLQESLHTQEIYTDKVKKHWEEEKKKLLDERDSFVSTLFMTRQDLDNLRETVESERASQKQSDAMCKETQRTLKETKKEVHSLQERLCIQQIDANKVKKHWEEEKKKLLDERDSLVSTLFMARQDLVNLVKIVEFERASQKQSDAMCKKMERTMKEKEKEVHFLQESLRIQQIDADKVKKHCEKEQKNINEAARCLHQAVKACNAKWESRWLMRQEEVAAEFQTLQENCEQKISHTIQEKENAVTSVRAEKTLVEETLESAEKRIYQTEMEWQQKYKALEDHHRSELAAKEDILKKSEERQKQSQDSEAKWLSKEEEWVAKTSHLEEKMELLIQENAELQVLALKTDKEKARMKKNEKKEKDKLQKRLKKEMKEQRKREKSDKEECETKKKENLKREQKVKKELEKKVEMERKETEKKAKKEKVKKRWLFFQSPLTPSPSSSTQFPHPSSLFPPPTSSSFHSLYIPPPTLLPPFLALLTPGTPVFPTK